MGKNPKAYVDTSALIAFTDRSDTYHPLFKRLFSNPPRLITTSLVVAEGHAWFLRRYDRTRALQFVAMIEDIDILSIKPVGKKELDEGAEILRRFSDQNLTMTDAVGLSVIAGEKLKTCWSTDRHLGLTGATLVIHQD